MKEFINKLEKIITDVKITEKNINKADEAIKLLVRSMTLLQIKAVIEFELEQITKGEEKSE